MNDNVIIKSTKKWVETVVIQLNLCPFAEREILSNSVRFSVSSATTEDVLLFDLHNELKLIKEDDAIETTLIMHPNVLSKFDDFNQFLLYVEDLLHQMDLEGVFQVASFHPDYQFANTNPEDAENYTNKSPYPTLHIIREASLDIAIANHPDTSLIPEKNSQLMREMGPDRMKALLQACFVK